MDSEQRVRYILEVLGQKESENAFKKHAKAIFESGKAANQLSAELKAASRMNEVLERSTQRAAAAQRTLPPQFLAAAQGATRAASANANMATNTARAAQTLGALGGSLGSVVPSIGAMGASIGRASGVIQAMTGALGGGPGGIIAGGLVAAVGIAAAAWDAFGDEQDEASAKVVKLNVSLAKQLELLQKQDSFRSQKELVGAGLAGAETQRAEATRLEQIVKNVEKQMAGIRATGVIDDRYRVLDATRRRLGVRAAAARSAYESTLAEDAEIAQEDAEYEAADERQRKREAKRKSGKPIQYIDTFGGRQRESEYFATMEREAQTRRQIQGLNDLERKQFGADYSFDEKAIAAAGKSAADAEQTAYAAKKAIRDLEKAETLAQYDEQEKRVAAYHNTIRSGAQESWGMVGAAAGNAFAAIARGEKVSLKEILKSIGSQAVASGTNKLFEAAGFAFIPGGQATAAGLAAVGGAQIAFGAALAGAGAAAGGGGGGRGGGGRGSASFSNQPLLAPASTETGGRQQPMVVNNYHLSSTITPTSRDAQQMREAEAEARRLGL